MIEGIEKLIFDKMEIMKILYYYIISLIIALQIYMRKSLKFSSRSFQPFRKNFLIDSQRFENNVFKVLGVDFTKLKLFYLYAPIYKTTIFAI